MQWTLNTYNTVGLGDIKLGTSFCLPGVLWTPSVEEPKPIKLLSVI